MGRRRGRMCLGEWLTFLAWFFVLTALEFAMLAAVRYRRTGGPGGLGSLLRRGFVGALIAWVSFGGVMLATRLGSVGEAAVLRETSTAGPYTHPRAHDTGRNLGCPSLPEKQK